MKTVTIKAYNGTGDAKTLAGEREVQKPETMAEAQELWSDEELIKMAWASFVIDEQRAIRSGTTTSAKKQVNALEAKARDNAAKGDNTLLRELEELGIVKSV